MMRRKVDWALGALMAGAFSTAAMADVVLSTRDGTISIQGRLLSFQDGRYTIESTIGTVAIDASKVECTGEECPEIDPLDQVVRVGGPGFLLSDLLPELVENYAVDAEGDVRPAANGAVEMVRGADTLVTYQTAAQRPEAAFQALLAGDLEIVLSDRRITDREIDAFLRQGLGDLSTPLREAIIAQDGITPLVSSTNPVRRLSTDQLAEVFSGNVTNWAELGGDDAPINIYLPQDGSTLAEDFEIALLEPEFLNFTSAAAQLPDLAQVANAVASDPNGIGIASLATARDDDQVELVASCGLPMRQDRFAVKSEDYLLSRRIYMYTADREMPTRAQKLVDNAKTVSAGPGLAGSAFLGLEPEIADMALHGHQLTYALADPTQSGELGNLRAFASAVLGAERLSVTFRFGSGSSQLDNKAVADAGRLADLLAEFLLDEREVMLIGFTDSIGKSEVNRVLSQRRARQVLDVIASVSETELDLDRVTPIGFGAAYPVACNTNEEGRQLNRRVEVWVK